MDDYDYSQEVGPWMRPGAVPARAYSRESLLANAIDPDAFIASGEDYETSPGVQSELTRAIQMQRDPRLRAILQQTYDQDFNGAAPPELATRGLQRVNLNTTSSAPPSLEDFLSGRADPTALNTAPKQARATSLDSGAGVPPSLDDLLSSMPDDQGNAFTRGVKKGLHGMAGAFEGLGGLAAGVVGADDTKKSLMSAAQEQYKQVEALSKPSDELKNLSWENAPAFAGTFAGEQALNLLTILIPGGIEAKVGSKLAADGIKTAVEATAKEATAKYLAQGVLAEDAAKFAAKEAAEKGAQLAATASRHATEGGLFAQFAGQGAGDIYTQQSMQGQDDPLKALGYGAVGAGTAMIGGLPLVNRALGNGLGLDLLSTVDKGFLGNRAVAAAQQAGLMAVGNVGQAAAARAGTNRDVLSPEAMEQYKWSGATGLLAGATFGGVLGGHVTDHPDTIAAKKAIEQAQLDAAKLKYQQQMAAGEPVDLTANPTGLRPAFDLQPTPNEFVGPEDGRSQPESFGTREPSTQLSLFPDLGPAPDLGDPVAMARDKQARGHLLTTKERDIIAQDDFRKSLDTSTPTLVDENGNPLVQGEQNGRSVRKVAPDGTVGTRQDQGSEGSSPVSERPGVDPNAAQGEVVRGAEGPGNKAKQASATDVAGKHNDEAAEVAEDLGLDKYKLGVSGKETGGYEDTVTVREREADLAEEKAAPETTEQHITSAVLDAAKGEKIKGKWVNASFTGHELAKKLISGLVTMLDRPRAEDNPTGKGKANRALVDTEYGPEVGKLFSDIADLTAERDRLVPAATTDRFRYVDRQGKNRQKKEDIHTFPIEDQKATVEGNTPYEESYARLGVVNKALLDKVAELELKLGRGNKDVGQATLQALQKASKGARQSRNVMSPNDKANGQTSTAARFSQFYKSRNEGEITHEQPLGKSVSTSRVREENKLQGELDAKGMTSKLEDIADSGMLPHGRKVLGKNEVAPGRVVSLLNYFAHRTNLPWQKKIAAELRRMFTEGKIRMPEVKFSKEEKSADGKPAQTHFYADGRVEIMIYRSGQDARTVLHEIVHAALYSYVEAQYKAKPEDRSVALKDLMTMREEVLAGMGKDPASAYIFKAIKDKPERVQLHEILAYALTDPGAQSALSRMRLTPATEAKFHIKDAWSLLLHTIRKVFGLQGVEKSALEHLVRTSDMLMKEAAGEKVEATGNETLSVTPMPARINGLKLVIEHNPSREDAMRSLERYGKTTRFVDPKTGKETIADSSLRALRNVKTGDLYTWNPHAAIHAQVKEHLINEGRYKIDDLNQRLKAGLLTKEGYDRQMQDVVTEENVGDLQHEYISANGKGSHGDWNDLHDTPIYFKDERDGETLFAEDTAERGGMTPERLDREIDDLVYNDGRVKGGVAWMRPQDFLDAVASPETQAILRQQIAKHGAANKGQHVSIQLTVADDGRIVAHEGRHRMIELADNGGVGKVAVVIRRYNASNEPLPTRLLPQQNDGNKGFKPVVVEPKAITHETAAELKQEFSNPADVLFAHVAEDTAERGGVLPPTQIDYSKQAPKEGILAPVFKALLPGLYAGDRPTMQKAEKSAAEAMANLQKSSPWLAAQMGKVVASANVSPAVERIVQIFKTDRNAPVTAANKFMSWLTGSRYNTEAIRRAFAYMDDASVESGLPKHVDHYIDNARDALERLLKSSDIAEDVRIELADLKPSEMLTHAFQSDTLATSGMGAQADKLVAGTKVDHPLDATALPHNGDPLKGRYHPIWETGVDGKPIITQMVHESRINEPAFTGKVRTGETYLMTKKNPGSPQQDARLFRKLTTVDSLLHDPSLGTEAARTIAASFLNTVALMSHSVAATKMARDIVANGRAAGKVFNTQDDLRGYINAERAKNGLPRLDDVHVFTASSVESKSKKLMDVLRRPGEFVLAPKDPAVYGDLAGKIIDGPTWMRLKDALNRDPVVHFQLYNDMMQLFKSSKTIYSPSTHVTNAMSNFTLAWINGLSWNAVKTGLSLYARYHLTPGKLTKDELQIMTDFMRSGATLGDWSHNEAKRLMHEAAEKQGNTSGVGFADTFKAFINYEKHLATGAGKLSTGAVRAHEFAGELYSAGDNMFRVAAFMSKMGELQKLHPDMEHDAMVSLAGQHAKEAFLDYDIDSRMLQTARQVAFPFASWSYAFAGRIAKVAKNEPWHLASLWAAYSIASAVAASFAPADDKKIRKNSGHDEKTFFGADKELNIGTTHNGRQIYFDAAHWFMPTPMEFKDAPNGYLGFHSWPSAITPGNPAINLMMLTFGVDPYTGQSFKKESNTDTQNAQLILKKMGEEMTPPLTKMVTSPPAPADVTGKETDTSVAWARKLAVPLTAIGDQEAATQNMLKVKHLIKAFDADITSIKYNPRIAMPDKITTIQAIQQRKAERVKELMKEP